MSVKPRIVIASPDRAEVAQLADWLTAEDIEPVQICSLHAAIDEAQASTYDAVIADAAFAFEGSLQAVVRTHNPRAPLVVVGGAADVADRFGAYHLDRPVDQALLLCHVTMALMDGRPARRSPRKRIPRFDAIVDGTPGCFVIDVSNEGLRFEFPRGRFAPPPHVSIRIPLVGIALSVRRVWVGAAPAECGAAGWCGVELFDPHPRAEANWRAFVSAVPSA